MGLLPGFSGEGTLSKIIEFAYTVDYEEIPEGRVLLNSDNIESVSHPYYENCRLYYEFEVVMKSGKRYQHCYNDNVPNREKKVRAYYHEFMKKIGWAQ